jgi:hypothetical protein
MHQDLSFSTEMSRAIGFLLTSLCSGLGAFSLHRDTSFGRALRRRMPRAFRRSSFCTSGVRSCSRQIQALTIGLILASFLGSSPLQAQLSTSSNDSVELMDSSLHADIAPELAHCDLDSAGHTKGPSSLLAPQKSGNVQSTGGKSKTPSPVISPRAESRGLSRDVYYRNRLEFALEIGYLPINIPFVFDVFLGDGYNMTPLKYTLVPVVGSLRWQIDDIEGPWIFRGNWDMTFSGSVTAIPRGPETRFYSYDMGIRRNFVPRHGKITPYFDGRAGMGRIDAKEPLGVAFAQGQNFTFTIGLGCGARYNFNSRYSISAGLNWMHISNMYLSQPKFSNYGINVYGPLFGLDIRLRKPRSHTLE